jgi:hypothetical protein
VPVGNNSRLLVDGSRSQNGGNWRCHLSLLDHDRLLVDVGNAGLSVDLRYTLDEASLNSIRSTVGGLHIELHKEPHRNNLVVLDSSSFDKSI